MKNGLRITFLACSKRFIGCEMISHTILADTRDEEKATRALKRFAKEHYKQMRIVKFEAIRYNPEDENAILICEYWK